MDTYIPVWSSGASASHPVFYDESRGFGTEHFLFNLKQEVHLCVYHALPVISAA